MSGHGGDEDQAIAALPHDAIEDQGAQQRAPVRDRFGERGLLIVEGCSDADVQPGLPWRARKGACPAHLEHAAPEILIVSCTGKPHDARAIRTDLRAAGPAGWDRFKGGRDGTPWFRGAPAAAFERLMRGPPAAELAETVREPRQPDQASGRVDVIAARDAAAREAPGSVPRPPLSPTRRTRRCRRPGRIGRRRS